MGDDDEKKSTERDWLLKADKDSSDAFDKAIITLASGALAVSITFIHDVAPKPVHVWWFGFAWIAFATSLLLILFSFRFSQTALRWEMKYLSGERKDKHPGGWVGTLTAVVNWASGIALLAGVFALVVFALYNVSGRR